MSQVCAAPLLRFAVRPLTPAVRTELAQFHTIRVILLILGRNIVPALALRAGKRHENTILFAFGRHAFPVLQPSIVAAPDLPGIVVTVEIVEIVVYATMRRRSGAHHSRLLYTIP